MQDIRDDNILEYVDLFLNESFKKENKLLFEIILKNIKEKLDDISFEKIELINHKITKYILGYNKKYNNNDLLNLESILIYLANQENKTLFDLQKINDGGYSSVFRLNSKIIKVGEKRACKKIVDNNKILLPEFKGYIGNIYLEITDYCDTKNISLEDLYLIYEELRNQGVMWLDPNNYNIGIINNNLIDKQLERRKNIKDLDIIENPNRSDIKFKNGDYVIIDLDHMVFEKDLNEVNRLKNILNEEMEQQLYYFEKRYEENKVLKKKR